ncbi:hypothetical protein SDC9_188745 [bioreactor metagenome]|uniref:Uncharacterized protein n=1 Tax=bioreactor metagenome TaxID=1076179 RepID=A0A645I118_9ZZZZ
MTHQFLKRFQIRAVLDHMNGKGVPQRLGSKLVFKLSQPRIFFKELPHALPRKPSAGIIDKKGLFTAAFILN